MLLDRRLLVVTGKGGTGKTVVAAALARLAASQGKKVLLCEVDSTGDIGRPFGVDNVTFDARKASAGVFLMKIDTEKALQEYMAVNLKVPFAVRVGPLAKAFDFVATAAPGVREILTMGKVCWEVKRENYDLVVLDAPSSGHVISQLGSPDSIGELVQVGPLTGQTAWMREMLRDPQRTGAVLVTTPEEMPVSETLHLAGRLRNETHTPIAALVVNRVLPQVFTRSDEETFVLLRADANPILKDVPGGVDAVLETVELALQLRRRQVEQINALRAADLGAEETIFVPQNFDSSALGGVVDYVEKSLEAELAQ